MPPKTSAAAVIAAISSGVMSAGRPAGIGRSNPCDSTGFDRFDRFAITRCWSTYLRTSRRSRISGTSSAPGLGMRNRNGEPVFPAGFLVAESVSLIGLLHRSQRFGEASGFLRLWLSDYLVFELGKNSQEFGGFEWLDDEAVGANPARFFRFERFQFAYGQQDWNLSCLRILLDSLANFQAAVARHVDVEHDQVRLVFGDFLEGRRAVIDSNYFVAGIGEDTPAHVLGSHAVVGKQYSSRQGFSFGEGETA